MAEIAGVHSPEVRASRRRTREISAAERGDMLALLEENFLGVNAGDFHRDLDGKDGALILSGQDGRLLGFSTYLVFDAQFQGRPLRACFFGDTVVDRHAWNSPALPRAVIQLLVEESSRAEPKDFYALLICSGHRTYQFLPFFCKDYVPRGASSDPRLLEIRDFLGRERFGAQFNAASGVARLDRGTYGIRPGISEPPPHLDPVTAYFISANPGWRQGDELVCLAKICPENLTPISRRLLGKRE